MQAVKATVFDALGGSDPLRQELGRAFADNDWVTTWLNLTGMSIQPCRSCGSCGLRTPGQCVIQDDMQPVLRAFALSQVIVYLTPIRFGGYSSNLKKAVDRLLPVGLPYYIVRGGHLLHPMRYGRKLIIGIGLSANHNPDEETNFKGLVKANGINLLSDSISLVYRPEDSPEAVRRELSRALSEVKIG